MTSRAFEIDQTIKREKRAELAFNGAYYLDSVFPESRKGVSPDDGQIEEWMFVKSVRGKRDVDFEAVRQMITGGGARRTRRVLEYLRKLREVCYNG